MRPPLKIFLLMSPVVIEGNNLYNLCMAPAPAPCIVVSLYRFLVVAVDRATFWTEWKSALRAYLRLANVFRYTRIKNLSFRSKFLRQNKEK